MKYKYLTLVFLIGGLNVSFGQTKKVLIEEHTGFWCQWCPRGTVLLHDLQEEHENLIPIAIHSSDEVAYDDYLSETPLGTAPSADVDRGGTELSTNEWESKVAAAIDAGTIAALGVTTEYNEDTRELKAILTTSFASKPSGEYRLSAVILEDGITGPAPDYNQSNAYGNGNNGAMGGYETLSGDVPANMIAYHHVARKLLGDYKGEEGSLPGDIEANKEYQYSFSYTLPEEWNEEYIYVVGILTAPDGHAENAAKSPYLDGTTNSKPKFSSEENTLAYVDNEYLYQVFAVDADDSDLEIKATKIPTWLSLGDVTSLGDIHTRTALTGTPEEEGEYEVVLSVSDGETTTEQVFTIVVEEAPEESWLVTGTKGFTINGNSSVHDVAIGKNNTTYVVLREDGSSIEVYARKSGQDWESLNLVGTGGNYARIAVGSDDMPVVAYSTSAGTLVKKWNGNAWQQIGPAAPSGVQLGLALNGDNLPTICMQDGSSSYQGNAYTFNGSSWEKVGGTKYSEAEGVWNSCEYDKDGNLIVLWNNFAKNRTAYVSRFDGTSWSYVGGGPVSTESVWFYQSFAVNDNGHIYVAFPTGENQGLNVYEYNGSTWSMIGENLSDGAVGETDLAINENGYPAITFVDEKRSKTISCIAYDRGTWSYIGRPNFSLTGGGSPRIAYNDNIPYVVYSDDEEGNKITARTYGFDPTSIKSIEAAATYALFPNPASGWVNIRGAEGGQFKLINMQGRVLVQKEFNTENLTVDLKNYPNGLYLIEIESLNQTTVHKLMVH